MKIKYIFTSLLIPVCVFYWITITPRKRGLFEVIKAICYNDHECDFTGQPVIDSFNNGGYRRCKNDLCSIVTLMDDNGRFLDERVALLVDKHT